MGMKRIPVYFYRVKEINEGIYEDIPGDVFWGENTCAIAQKSY